MKGKKEKKTTTINSAYFKVDLSLMHQTAKKIDHFQNRNNNS